MHRLAAEDQGELQGVLEQCEGSAGSSAVGSAAVELKMLTPEERMSLACPREPCAAPHPTGSSQSRGSCQQGGARCQAAPEPASQPNLEWQHVYSGQYANAPGQPETHTLTLGPPICGAISMASKVEQHATGHQICKATWVAPGRLQSGDAEGSSQYMLLTPTHMQVQVPLCS